MEILVTGGAGFLGAGLIRALLAARDAGQAPPLLAEGRIISLDLSPCPVSDLRVRSEIGSIADPAVAGRLIGPQTAAVFHLAAVVSGQAEAEFETGMAVNLDGTRHLLDACRIRAPRPFFFLSSSLAVFGRDCPPVVGEDQVLRPQSSYGAQKAIGEMLVADYSRRGFVEGVAARIPTVVIRPGRPNAAASSFASSILREPVAGESAICPVPLDLPLWITSPDAAIRNIVVLAGLGRDRLGGRVPINLPGITVTPREMLAALERRCGAAARVRVTHAPDLQIEAIVASWPSAFDTTRARALGMTGDTGIDEILERHLTMIAESA
ncbi:MAG: NAD-dependent epimerase, partial [Alphaproteobacteria bacterium HGW-Alphaproteobacteria-2]